MDKLIHRGLKRTSLWLFWSPIALIAVGLLLFLMASPPGGRTPGPHGIVTLVGGASMLIGLGIFGAAWSISFIFWILAMVIGRLDFICQSVAGLSGATVLKLEQSGPAAMDISDLQRPS